MQLFLSKLISLFVMPLGASLLIATLAIVLFLLRKMKSALSLSILHVFLLSLCSMPVVSDYLIAKWERRFAPITVSASVSADAAIVLGGTLVGPVAPSVEENLGEGVDRVLRASRLYKSGKVERIIVSGGNLPWLRVPVPEAEVMKKLLIEWGVPADAILVEGKSRNTRENAVNVKKMLVDQHVESVLLVNSALHMPRAMRVFRRVGVKAIPSPTDYKVVDRGQREIMDYLPDAGALGNMTALLREVVGMVYYKFNGWI